MSTVGDYIGNLLGETLPVEILTTSSVAADHQLQSVIVNNYHDSLCRVFMLLAFIAHLPSGRTRQLMMDSIQEHFDQVAKL